MTSYMSDLNHHQQNQNNSFPEEDYAVFNVTFEVTNSSLHDFNYNNTIYEVIEERVASPMEIFFTPCLITLGISGNLLALYVFFSSQLRYQSTSQYLSALAISDSLFLAQLLPPWLSTMGISSIFHRDPFCKGFLYVSYVTCCLSSWLVIAFTIERFIAVQYPLQRPSVCTVRRARYVIAGLVLGSMVVNLPVLHFTGSENGVCHIKKENLKQAAIFNWVDTTVTFTIPLTLIIFFNTWIATAVNRVKRHRIKLTQEELRAVRTAGRHTPRPSDLVYLRSQRRITNMLLIVSTTFMLFNFPAYVLRLFGYAYDLDSGDVDETWLMAQKIATLMFTVNFGINFFLYCFTGQNFRRALVETVPCCRWIARIFNTIFHRTPTNNGRTCSVTTSAASTNATSTEVSFVRPAARRARLRSKKYIRRWTFDNSRQRRGVAVSGASESIAMCDTAPQPESSRVITCDPPSSETPQRLSVQTLAVIEPRRPITHQRSFEFESRRYAVERRRTAVGRSPTGIESRRCDIDSRQTAIESRHPTLESSRAAFEARRLAADFRNSAVDSRPSGCDPPHQRDEASRSIAPQHGQ